MAEDPQGLALIKELLEIYDQTYISSVLNDLGEDSWCRETINRWVKGKVSRKLSHREFDYLKSLLPLPYQETGHEFRFIDLFAGIGGLRRGFEEAKGKCVFTSEWDKHAVRTYKANHYCDLKEHVFNHDIRTVTLSDRDDIEDKEAYRYINEAIPDHDVLLAGFPCQPFSIAGVSKKNSLGGKHGFECNTQGTLFFDVARIINAKRPPAFLLENVKNLKSHDKGRTFRVILDALDELGYEVADIHYQGSQDPKIIDAANFLPQHRERIVLVGFRRDLAVHEGFSLRQISDYMPETVPKFGDILEPEQEVDDKYILTPKLWEYLYEYAKKHKAKGNGFGFGLTGKEDIARTLSARYHKDGSEVLVDRGWDDGLGFGDLLNKERRPRRLTPKECARLMGFDAPHESNFKIPVSDTQAYRQFGNSVAVPVFRAVAKMMKPRVLEAKRRAGKDGPKAA